MAGKKYTGPERRSARDRHGNINETRRVSSSERRIKDQMAGRTHSSLFNTEESGRVLSDRNAATRRGLGTGLGVRSSTQAVSDLAHQDVVSVHETAVRPERRIGGAGRRSGDLARALETEEPVIYQMGKGAMKSVGKLAKKAAKHIPAIGIAAGIYDLVQRAKQ